ncbi:MAG: hypothetical protein AAFY56_17810 [Pseudomonadota bacterium]
MSAEFTLESYKSVIGAFIDNGYAVIDSPGTSDAHKQIFLRHDVDYSLEFAAQMACANSDVGARSCFCILPRSKLYNLAEEDSQRHIEAILGFGQTIGLHFELPRHLRTKADAEFGDVERSIHRDYALLKGLVGDGAQPIFSWHSPSTLSEQHAQWVTRPVDGLLNTYKLVADGLFYVSDSNHRYSIQEWFQIAADAPLKLHALFHPFQWLANADSMEEVLGVTLVHLIKNLEPHFLENRPYKSALPNGLQPDALESLVKELMEVGQRNPFDEQKFFRR